MPPCRLLLIARFAAMFTYAYATIAELLMFYAITPLSAAITPCCCRDYALLLMRDAHYAASITLYTPRHAPPMPLHDIRFRFFYVYLRRAERAADAFAFAMLDASTTIMMRFIRFSAAEE